MVGCAVGEVDFDDVGGWGEVGDVEGGGVAEGGCDVAGHVEDFNSQGRFGEALEGDFARGWVGISHKPNNFHFVNT